MIFYTPEHQVNCNDTVWPESDALPGHKKRWLTQNQIIKYPVQQEEQRFHNHQHNEKKKKHLQMFQNASVFLSRRHFNVHCYL